MNPPAPEAAAGILVPGGAGRGESAFALPRGLSARAFGPAWIVALAAHLAIAAAAILAPAAAPLEEPPPVRLVFFEPPPPPPAPLGQPGGTGAVHALVEPKPPEPVVAKPEKARNSTRETRRLRRAEPKAKAKPRPEPPVAESRPESAPAALAEGVSAGSSAGEVGGVVGGVAGGMAGGVVGGTGSGPVPAAQVAHPPVLIRKIAPVYPPQARQNDVEGLVLLEAILDREGRVEPTVKVVQSVPLLDAEAIAAVRRWRFRPARNQGGEALRVILEIPIRFVLR